MTDRRLEGVIRDVAMLDLTPLTSADDLAGITRLEDVAIVLAPESLMPAVVGVPAGSVGRGAARPASSTSHRTPY